LAPERSAPTMSSRVSFAVHMMMGSNEGSRVSRSFFSTSTPFMPGIMMSSRTSSHGFASSQASAWNPSSAMCTVKPERSRRRESMSRLFSLSSTTRTTPVFSVLVDTYAGLRIVDP
jgi:hypothetical protein